MRPFPRNFPVATVSSPPKGTFTRVEVSALKHAGMPGLHGSSPLLRLQSDERLVALIRRGNHGAFEALVSRYQSRLHAFCRHMLGSREDAEDVLQEVFAAAFNAMQADERPLNVRPWLYRIARNRSLNHLRKQQPIGVDSMDVHYSEGGLTTADKVHKREDFRLLLVDVQGLPETQRTALLLREIDALSYDQIAEAMDTTVPSVKSLLVRARVSLAEAAEARQLSCAEVRLELGEVAEGLKKMPRPVRRHVKTCDRCAAFKTTLRDTNKALAAIFPVGPLLLFKKLALAHLGTTASGGGATAASSAGASAARPTTRRPLPSSPPSPPPRPSRRRPRPRPRRRLPRRPRRSRPRSARRPSPTSSRCPRPRRPEPRSPPARVATRAPARPARPIPGRPPPRRRPSARGGRRLPRPPTAAAAAVRRRTAAPRHPVPEPGSRAGYPAAA